MGSLGRLSRAQRLSLPLVVGGVALAVLAGCAENGTPAGAAADPLGLAGAPWAGSEPASIADTAPWPSLRFAPGIDYPEALTRVFVAARERSATVEGATVAEPLPAEVVYVAPQDPAQGIRLSLTAPWGWVPGGAIRPPSIALPGSLTPWEARARIEEARRTGAALPEGASVDVPRLEDCQIAHGTPDARPPC